MNQLVMLLFAAVAGSPADADAALAHRQQYPEAEWGYHYYLSVSSAEQEHQGDLIAATQLMVASASLQPIIERCSPQLVTATLMHIDLRDLGWSATDWHHVLADYPYAREKLPLVVRADWLLLQLADQTASDAYFRLMFGEAKVPTKRDEWLDLLQVSRTRVKGFDALRFGLIESKSGVAKQDARWIESHPVAGGYAWGTRDVLEVTADKDPLENPDGSFRHDGEEWIVGLPKISLGSGVRGTLQAYMLSNGQGGIVFEAPVDLVEDSTLFRGTREIRNPGSCIQCHAEGLNLPSSNDFRSLIADGVDVYADKTTQQQLEAFHLSNIDRTLERSNEDFQAIVLAATGLQSKAVASSFRRAVDRYDAPLTLEDTARELGATPADWRLALAAASGVTQLGPRLVGLAHNRTIPRAAWEEQCLAAASYLHAWETN